MVTGSDHSGNLGLSRRRWIFRRIFQLSTIILRLLPTPGFGALAYKIAVVGSPDPLGAAAAPPILVVCFSATGCVAGINGENGNLPKPGRARAELRSLYNYCTTQR